AAEGRARARASQGRARARAAQGRAGPESAGSDQSRRPASKLADPGTRPVHAGRGGRRRPPEGAVAWAQRQASRGPRPAPPGGVQRPRGRRSGPQRPRRPGWGGPVRSVVIAGGGTGGHIEPAMALADALRRIDPDVRITCLGTERGLETKVIPARGYALDLIPAVPLPRALTPALLAVPGKMIGAVRATVDVLDRAQASVVVGFGGYVATPGYLAARRRNVPIVVHEANPRPGLANRIGARLTRHVFTGQAGTRLPHAT